MNSIPFAHVGKAIPFTELMNLTQIRQAVGGSLWTAEYVYLTYGLRPVKRTSSEVSYWASDAQALINAHLVFALGVSELLRQLGNHAPFSSTKP